MFNPACSIEFPAPQRTAAAIRIVGGNAAFISEEYGIPLIDSRSGEEISTQELECGETRYCYCDCPSWVVRDSGVLGS